MQDNIIAAIIFILAIAGLIALVVYKLRKDNNNEKVTVEDFLGLYHTNLFNVLQDVVSLLSININDFETKEDYERTIISTTIAKLEENCDEFGISSALLKLVDREVLTNILYDILYTNKVQIFFSTLPEKIIKTKPELYDDEVIEAFENAEPVLGEDEDTHTESQEEQKHEEAEVAEQEEEVVDASNNEKDEEVKAEDESIDNVATTTDLPPREVYYGEKKEAIKLDPDAFENAEFEVFEGISDLSPVAEEDSKFESLSSEICEGEISNDPNPVEDIIPTFEEAEPIGEIDPADEVKTLAAEVDAALEDATSEE